MELVELQLHDQKQRNPSQSSFSCQLCNGTMVQCMLACLLIIFTDWNIFGRKRQTDLVSVCVPRLLSYFASHILLPMHHHHYVEIERNNTNSHPHSSASTPWESTSPPSVPCRTRRKCCSCPVYLWSIALAKIQKRICGPSMLKRRAHLTATEVGICRVLWSIMLIQVNIFGTYLWNPASKLWEHVNLCFSRVNTLITQCFPTLVSLSLPRVMLCRLGKTVSRPKLASLRNRVIYQDFLLFYTWLFCSQS